MAEWRFVAARSGINAIQLVGEITEAHDRSITWRLNDACQASFSLDGRHELATMVEELTIDVLVYRDDELWFRGRLGASGDEVTPSEHQVSLTALDYTALLDRRRQDPPDAPWTYTSTDQAVIVRSLLNRAQSMNGGWLDILVHTNHIPNTGVLRTWTIPLGKFFGEAIDELAALDNGFEWTIDEQLIGRLWYPQRGTARDLVCEYGSTVASVRRTFDPAEYANSVMVTGAEGVASQIATAPDILTRPEGRWDVLESFPDLTTTALLAARATKALADRSTLRPAYTCTMFPGKWSPRELWLGDATWLQVRSGRLNVSTSQRVTQIQVSVDDAGVETVEITLGKVPPGMARRFVSLDRRLSRVERLGTV